MALTDNQLALTKLYLAAFNRAPETGGLDYWSEQLAAGQSFDSLVQTVFSLDIVKAIYPDAMSDSAFLTAIYHNIFGKTPDAEGLAYWMEQLAGGAPRSTLVMTMIDAGLDTPDGTLGKAFVVNRYEMAQHAVQSQLAQGTEIGVERLKQIMAGVTADTATVAAAKTGNNQYSGAEAKGVVVDGYVKGATVFADANGNGRWDEGEAKAVSDAKGNYTLTGAKGAIIASGGTDISTGTVNGTFTAPAGSTVINPLTTLIQAVAEAGNLSAANAEALVKSGLGIAAEIDLTTFDPVAAATATGASVQAIATALQVQTAAAQVNTLMGQVGALLNGAGASQDAGANAAVEALAALIAETSAPVDLSASATIAQVVTAAAAGTTAAATVAALAADAGQVIANLNQAIATAAGSGSTGLSSLVEIAKVQVAAETVETALAGGAQAGNISTALSSTTGSALTTAIAAAVIGDVNGDGNTDATTTGGGTSTGGGGGSPTIDTAPVLSSSTPADNAAAIVVGSNIVLTFSETVGAGTGDIVITNAGDATDTRTISVTDITQVSISGNTVTINPAADLHIDSSYSVTMAGGVIKDGAGNAYAGIPDATTLNFTTTDTIAPTVAVTLADAALLAGETTQVTFTFSEVPSGFTLSDVTAANGTLSGLSATADPLVYTASFTPAADVEDGTNTITAGTDWGDAGGNAPSGTTDSGNYTINTRRPTVTVTLADSALGAGETTQVTFTFSEAPVGFGAADITAQNGTLSGLSATADPLVYTATFTPAAEMEDGTNAITVSTGWSNATGNAPSASTNSVNYTVDTLLPTLTGSSPADNATEAAPGSNVVLTFSEAVQAGAGNIVITNVNDAGDTRTIDVTDASQVTIAGNTVTIDPTANLNTDTTYNVQMAAGVIKDLAGNVHAGIADAATLNFATQDTIAPAVAIALADSALRTGDTSQVSFTFSEAPSNFDAADVTVQNGTLSGLTATADPLVYTATFTPDANVEDSTNVVTAGTGWSDAAGNAPAASAASANYTVDTLAPALNSSAPADNATAMQSHGNIVLTFSEAVQAGSGNIVIANTNDASDTRTIAVTDASQVTISGSTVTINPAADLRLGGSYSVQLAAGAIRDLAGNDYAGIADAATLNFTVSIFQLSRLDGSTGFRLDGVAVGDYSGSSVSAAGDVNGDGYADLIVGANRADPNGTNSGASYVVFGQSGGFGSSFDLSSLDGTNGFRLEGKAAFDYSGGSVSAAGDVNGDGFDDVIVGARGADPHGGYSGASYVVFGKASGFASSIALSSLDGSTGFRLDGVAASDFSGGSVSAAGDINGDGLADLIVGARRADPGGLYDAGSSYVVFGRSGGFGPGIDLSSLDGTTGFRLDGAAAYDYSGGSVSEAGDINGDGYADLIVGAWGSGPDGVTDAGSSYVVFGKSGGFGSSIDLSSLNGTDGFRLEQFGAVIGSLGYSVSTAGDVNGDGYADLIVGAPFANTHGISAAGSSYVVFGQSGGFGSSIDLSSLDGTNGFRLDGGINGLQWASRSGHSVSAAGDVNGDGYDDLIVGAWGADPGGITDAGSSYVVFGKSGGFGSSIDLPSLDGMDGFRLDGALDDRSGISVSADDVNGDGFADLIVGAYKADPNGFGREGASYVVFGGDFTGAVTHLGTSGADTLTGASLAERFVGGQGNDTLAGGGGADVLYGGAGDDIIAVSDLTFQRIDGGSGSDKLQLSGSSLSLDLAAFRNKIAGIETIDLTGSGDNSLTLTARDLLNLSDSGNTLTVDGNAGDIVHAGSGWTDGGEIGGYHHYTQGQAVLLVGTALTVDIAA